MPRALVVFVLAGIAAASAAAADPLLPRERHTKADLAKARVAMLVARDLGAGWKGERSNEPERPLRCKTFRVDEHDLVETGEAESPGFARGVQIVGTSASVYETTAMTTTLWRRAIRPGLAACLAEDAVRHLSEPNFVVKRKSAARVAFPNVASSTAAYHLVLTVTDETGSALPLHLDYVLLRTDRTVVNLQAIAFLAPFPKAELRRLAGLVGRRMR